MQTDRDYWRTYSFSLERLGSDGLDWESCRHRSSIRWVGILQVMLKNKQNSQSQYESLLALSGQSSFKSKGIYFVMRANHRFPFRSISALTYLIDLWPVPPVDTHVSLVDRGRYLWSGTVHAVRSHLRVATIHGQGAMGRWGGDGVAQCSMLG